MSLRVSQIALTLILLDEFDAPKNAEPVIFTGDAQSTAVEKVQTFLTEIDAKLADAVPKAE